MRPHRKAIRELLRRIKNDPGVHGVEVVTLYSRYSTSFQKYIDSSFFAGNTPSMRDAKRVLKVSSMEDLPRIGVDPKLTRIAQVLVAILLSGEYDVAE
jgi:hypothetical protein